ncbi:MAG TPA: hypothetical protein ENK05_06365 [Gammaproteobacteria bacterium]|nr:hypothetical protein [Gammaproteobacteria bacterium]
MERKGSHPEPGEGAPEGDSLKLLVAPEALRDFCERLLRRSRDIGRTHEALVTLETFLAVFGRGQAGSPGYQAIEKLMKSCTERTRRQLLVERSAELVEVLQRRDPAALAAVHAPLSREGFYQAAQAALEQLPEEEIGKVRDWARDWTRQARRDAERASGYPDALDFAAAGLDVEVYQAMLDLDRMFGG